MGAPMAILFWSRTEDGWAVNLDGTNAALEFQLPRIEIRVGPLGWACACHLGDGSAQPVPIGRPASTGAAMRAGIQGSLAAVGARYGAALRELLLGSFEE